MDHYVRMGLLVAWGLFGIALLIWWWRRRGSKHYPYSERANAILDAIRDGCDIGMIYWSKREKRYLSRVVTPRSIEGYAMRAVDHKTGAERLFKVTRIRLLKSIPPGATRRAPSRLVLISPIAIAVVCLGLVSLGLLAYSLFNRRSPSILSSELPPLPPPTRQEAELPTPARPSSNSLAITDHSTETASPVVPPVNEPVVKLHKAPVPPPADDFMSEPTPTVLVVSNNCYLIVENHPSYKVNQVAGVLQALFRYRADRAIELEQSVRTLGRAVVWSGPKDRAERFRQYLEGYDVAAKIELAGTNSVSKTATNAVAPATPDQP